MKISKKSIMAIFFLMVTALAGFAAGKDILVIAQTADPGTVDVQKTTDMYGVPLKIFDRLE